MLSNAYFLAKCRFDIAENELAKILQNFAKFANAAIPNHQRREAAALRARPLREKGAGVRAVDGRRRRAPRGPLP